MKSGVATTALSWLRHSVPGIALAAVLALLARLIADAIGGWAMDGKGLPLSPVLCAVLLGVLWRNLIGVSDTFDRGLHWVMHTLLKAGIALVGLRLTLAGAGQIAASALPVVCGCIITALAAGALICRALGVPLRLGVLLSVGTAVCGCTAVVALSPVIRARHEDTGFALMCVVMFGCFGMLFYPWIAHYFFAQSPTHAGIFLGTAIHDTSQVIGASLIYSQQHVAPEAVAAASITKLLRNLSIAILIPAAAWVTRSAASVSGSTSRSFALPGFVIGFVCCVTLRTVVDAYVGGATSAGQLWSYMVQTSQLVSELLLICGMTAVGLSVSLGELRSIGWRPLLAGLSIAATVCTCSLLLTLAVLHF